MPTSAAILNIHALYAAAPGIRFAFGSDFVDGTYCPVFEDLLQYGAGDELIALV
jgi:hypothetical protein